MFIFIIDLILLFIFIEITAVFPAMILPPIYITLDLQLFLVIFGEEYLWLIG